MRVLAATFAAAACLSAQSAELAPPVLLNDVVARMREHLDRQPNYTCLETVERHSQQVGSPLQVQDTMRVEVALVDDKEMFAWPGSKEFEDVGPTELVSTGMFGNGNFALYPRMLFGGRGPQFRYAGEEKLGEVRVARFDFRVARAESGYHLSVSGRKGRSGYHGSFYADMETHDLRRLEMVAEDIPAELGLTAAEDRVDYAQVKIGDDFFLLPVESSLMMSSPQLMSRNHVRFTGCRKFAGESSLILTDEEFADAPPTPVPVVEVALPVGSRVELILTTRIDFDKAFVGQAVEARLNSAVKRGKDVLVPKNAIARGRVVQMQRWPRQHTLGIQWTALEWPGGRSPLKLEFEGMALINTREVVNRDVAGNLVFARPGRQSLNNTLIYWRVVE